MKICYNCSYTAVFGSVKLFNYYGLSLKIFGSVQFQLITEPKNRLSEFQITAVFGQFFGRFGSNGLALKSVSSVQFWLKTERFQLLAALRRAEWIEIGMVILGLSFPSNLYHDD